MKKKIFSLVATVIMLFVCCSPVNAFADNVNGNDYIRFEQPVSRIASNGAFTFDVHIRLASGKFKANGNYITIQTRARIYGAGTETYRTDSSVKFRVTLCKSSGKTVGSYVGMADNIYGGRKFTGITKGDTYYFVITVLDENIQHSGYESVKGTGNVSNVTVL